MLWEKKGLANTEATVKAALERARALNLQHIVVASSTGKTAEKFINQGLEVICVTHHVGYKGPGVDEMGREARERLQSQGIKVLTTTHLLAGVDRSLRFKFEGVYPPEIIASALRMLGQGVKVCVEIATMALDAGLIPHGQEVMVVGGSSRGADTSCVIVPAHANNFFDTRIKEIVCRPRNN